MPKMKTNRSIAKRFSKTASGKFKFKRRGLRHILTKHSSANKRKLKNTAYLSSSDASRVQRALPYS